MKQKSFLLFYYVMGGLVVLILMLSAWWIGRTVNYNLFYKSMVQTEIRSMVKQEALK